MFFCMFAIKKLSNLVLCSEGILKGKYHDLLPSCACLNSGILDFKQYFLFPREGRRAENAF